MTINHNLQHDYISDLLNVIPLSSTGEISISLSVEIESDMGFIIIERGINGQEERMFYHRKNSNTIYVYSENRINPRYHDIGSKVILDSISSINYAHDNGFGQMYIFKKSENNIIIKGGQFYINGEMITISDLDTETGTQQLSVGQDNYIYIKDNDYIITTTIDNTLYSLGIISVEVGGNISNIEITNALPMGGGMSTSERDKLNSLNSSLYEKLTNKTSSIRDINNANDTKYPTELSVALKLENKVDKVTGMGLSKNDFNDTLKDSLDELIGLDLGNKDLNKTQVVAGTGIVVDDLGTAGWRVTSNTAHSAGTNGDNIDIYPTDNTSESIYKDGQTYVVLKDHTRSGFVGSTKFKDGSNPTVSVYYQNPNGAGKILIDTHIRVVDSLGRENEYYKSIPYQVDIESGHGVFTLDSSSFTGLDYTAATVMYIKVFRVGAFVTDVNGIEFNDKLDDIDTLNGEIRIKSMFIDYDVEVVATTASNLHLQIETPDLPINGYNKLYFKNDNSLYKLDSNGNEVEILGSQLDQNTHPLIELTTTGDDNYVIDGFATLVDKLLIPFISDIHNTGPATLDFGGTGPKDIVLLGGAPLTDSDIESNRLVFLRYDLSNDNYNLIKVNGFGNVVTPEVIVPTDVTYTITNGLIDRDFDANSTSINELMDVLYTLTNDLTSANVFGTGTSTSIVQTYITNNATGVRAFDSNSTSISELADVIATIITDLSNGNMFNGGVLQQTNQTYSVTNSIIDRDADANSTVINELADIVATLIEDLKNTNFIL